MLVSRARARRQNERGDQRHAKVKVASAQKRTLHTLRHQRFLQDRAYHRDTTGPRARRKCCSEEINQDKSFRTTMTAEERPYKLSS